MKAKLEKHGIVNKPRVRRVCNIEGCKKQSMRGGVCWSHGAKDIIKSEKVDDDDTDMISEEWK
jgi:hypothetical protein